MASVVSQTQGPFSLHSGLKPPSPRSGICKVLRMKRNLERAGCLTPCPDDEALLLRQKQRLLQVREKGNVAERRRQDLRQWKNRQLQCLAEECKAEWQEIQKQQVRDLEWLYLAQLLGMGGGCGKDSQPALEEPVQRAAARQQRAKEKHRAALREEKSHKEEPAKQSAWHTKSRKKAAGIEKQGASKVTGVTWPPLIPPGKRKGKQRPLVKTSGGHRHLDPWVSRGTGVDKLYPHPDKTRRLERGKKVTWDRRRQLGKREASFTQGLKHNRLDLSPEGRRKDLEQLWPVSSTCKRGAVSAVPPDKHGNWKKWQRELQFAFEELFDTNRKLKNHLNQHLELWSRNRQGPDGEPGCLGVQDPSIEAQREKKILEAETAPAREPRGPVVAHQTLSKINLRKLLDKMENPKYHRLAKCVFEEKNKISKANFKSGDKAPSPEAEISVAEENLLSCTAESGQESPETVRLAEGTPQLHPREQADGGGVMEAIPAPETEQGRQEQLELFEQMEHPEMNLESVHNAQLEDKESEQREAHLKPSFVQVRWWEGGQGPSVASPSGISIMDDNRHSQMIRDLQLQILEQKKLHKQFLEEARKRLQEFQKIC
ncbi:protein DDC8 homolog [Elephas maximus indicus]|uniref:protein DDC8 homolog n=1 Tax=Elephas maximus indicus TaxID=99487 RepID=UPI002116EC26|nr:protein DDC8 homolog [Elephas maximus indicus]